MANILDQAGDRSEIWCRHNEKELGQNWEQQLKIMIFNCIPSVKYVMSVTKTIL
jgi:hypothetical protein